MFKAAMLRTSTVQLSCIFLLLLHIPLAMAGISSLSVKCGGPFDLCGYVDRKSGETRIPFKFEDALSFSKGLAAVKSGGSWDYIDNTGSMIIEPRFALAGAFTSGHAEVVIDNQAGVIDRNGEIVVETQFARAIPFSEDTVLAAEGSRRPEDRLSLAPLDRLNDIFIKRRFGLYRINQGWLSEKRYKITYFDEPGRGLIWASEEEGKSPLFGLLKADGSWQVTPRYTKVYWRIGDFATVQGIPVEEDEQTSQAHRVLSGAVDKNGRLVIPLKFEGLSYWRGGYGLARKFGKEPKLGLVSSKGQLLTGRYFDDVDRPTDGRLPRVLKDGQWFSVTADGKLVADERDGHVHVDCPGGLKIIEKQGFFAASHPSLGPPIVTQRATKHTLLSDQLCARPYTLRVQEHQYKFVTQDGRLLPSTGWYDNVYSFDGGLTPVSFNGKWGVIDESGQFLVPPVYDKLSRNRNDSIWFKEPSRTGPAREPAIFRVESNGRQFWIDIHNREVSKPKHPTKEESEAILLCGGVLKRFERTGLWGMKRSDGRVLVEPEYRALTCFRRGTAWGALNGQKFWCPIGTDGKKKASMSCKKYVDVVRITDVRAEEMSKDPHENNVLWLRALLDYAQGKRTEPPGFLGMTF